MSTISNLEFNFVLRMRYLPIILLIFSYLPSKSQIDFLLDYKVFDLPQEQPYIEFYLSLNGNSIFYQDKEDGTMQGEVEVTYLLTKNDSIANFKKFRLITPIYKEGDFASDIIDVKRLSLPPGDYQFEVEIKDIFADKISASRDNPISLESSTEKISFSSVILNNGFHTSTETASAKKNNLFFNPIFRNFLNRRDSVLGFYVEIYGAKSEFPEGEAYLVDYAIIDKVSRKVINNNRGFKRAKSEDISVIADQFSIKALPSGNYFLQFNVRNKMNEIIHTEEISLQRSNPNLASLKSINVDNSFVNNITDIEEIKEYIRSLQPISDNNEYQFAKNQMAYADLNLMRKYFLNFWKTRDPNNPEEAWIEYKKEVDITNKEFGYGGVKGYQTERGRIYLQYGKPNSVQNLKYEIDTYPVSVWQYYKLNGLTNRRFIFYSPSMEMLGYEVLHSNVPGEVQNPNWEFELQRKSNNTRPTQENPNNEVINDRVRDLFNNPR